MRPVLQLALWLLGATLALNLAGRLAPSARVPVTGADGGLSVIAVARGPLQPNAILGSGPETLDAGILVGDLTLRLDNPARGLRVARFDPGFGFRAFANHDLAASGEDIDDFLSTLTWAHSGTVLVLASHGILAPLRPESEERLGELEAALQELGASFHPLRSPRSSWALLVVRRRDRWQPLAEVSSESSGVALAFTVSPDLARYDEHDFRPDRRRVSHDGAVTLPLHHELGTAHHRDRGVNRNRWATVGDVTRSAIVANPTRESDRSEVRWEDVPVGPGARLSGFAGLQAAPPDGGTVTFQVLLNGEVRHEQRVAPPQAGAWHPFELDLASVADGSGRPMSLALRTIEDPDARWAYPLWGDPVLTLEARP